YLQQGAASAGEHGERCWRRTSFARARAVSVNRAAVVAPVGALRHGALRGVARPAQGSRGHPESTGPERGFLHPHSGGAAAALEWQNAPRMTSTNPGGERET